MKQLISIFILSILIHQSLSGQIQSTFNRPEIDSLLCVLKTSKTDDRIIILNKLSSALAPLQFDSAQSFANEALSIARQSNNHQQEALALFNMGNNFFSTMI